MSCLCAALSRRIIDSTLADGEIKECIRELRIAREMKIRNPHKRVLLASVIVMEQYSLHVTCWQCQTVFIKFDITHDGKIWKSSKHISLH